tara:strand:+ start:1111 stop:1608 length:498 start_codon:yes stop_codon:yes gene_type:complete
MRFTFVFMILGNYLFAQVLLDVNAIPKGSTVLLNGDLIGETPIRSMKISPGNYSLDISAKDYAPVTHEFIVQDAKQVKMNFVLNPLYKIKFKSKDSGLTFELNNEHSWEDNKIKLILESGKHTLRVYDNGHLFDEQIIHINRNMEFVYSRQQQYSETFVEDKDIE